MPVTIHLATVSSTEYGTRTPDAILVRPTVESGLEYFLAGYSDVASTTYSPL